MKIILEDIKILAPVWKWSIFFCSFTRTLSHAHSHTHSLTRIHTRALSHIHSLTHTLSFNAEEFELKTKLKASRFNSRDYQQFLFPSVAWKCCWNGFEHWIQSISHLMVRTTMNTSPRGHDVMDRVLGRSLGKPAGFVPSKFQTLFSKLLEGDWIQPTTSWPQRNCAKHCASIKG